MLLPIAVPGGFRDKELVGQVTTDERDDLSLGEKRLTASWARQPRKIFETDPLLCPRCGVTMKIVSVVMEAEVIDEIIRHRERAGTQNVFEPRAPPSAPTHQAQAPPCKASFSDVDA